MLTIPWFVTSTVRDLLRYPRPNQPRLQPQTQQLQQQQQFASSATPSDNTKPPNNTTPLQPKPNPSPLRGDQIHRVSPQTNQPEQAAAVSKAGPVSNNSSNVIVPETSSTQMSAAPCTARKIPQPLVNVGHVQGHKSSNASSKLAQASNPATQISTSRQSEHRPAPVQKSSATLILTPSVSANRMSETWAQEMVDKYTFDFDKADVDKSGVLSQQEVIDVLRKVGFKGSDEEGKFIFGHLDRNNDEKISRDEFRAALTKLPKMSIKEFVYRQAFKQIDKDNSGYLTKDEIIMATKGGGDIQISDMVLNEVFTHLTEKDEDNKIAYEEFLELLGLEESATVLGQLFRHLDKDKSGFLSREEILDGLKADDELKLKASKIADLLNAWCKDKDKKISYSEFVAVWMNQRDQIKGKGKK